MEQDYIIVDETDFALSIRKELKRLGIEPKYTNVTDFKKITKEELSSLRNLSIENRSIKDISVLEYCTNLKKLVIKSENAKHNNTFFQSDAAYNYQLNKSQISDFSVISKLKSLQFLTIIDDPNLTSLDLTGLNQLTSLELVGNHKLTQIKGLETLHELTDLTMVKNSMLTTFDFKQILENSELFRVNLDYDLYPFIRKQYPTIAEDILSRLRDGKIAECNWSENLSDLEFNTINTYNIEKMEIKAQEILSNIIGPDYTEIEKIAAIYAYIIQNVKYDHESLKASKDADAKKEFSKQHGIFGESIEKILNRQQSSYNAILEGRAVCEGYSNMMHYLLKSVGINSMTVHCSADLSKEIVGSNSNHSIIKVEINGEAYYFDPTWDAGETKLSNFFRTKDEISKNHVLSMSEQEILSPIKKSYTNEELSVIFKKVIADRSSGKNIIKNKSFKKM